MSTSTASRRRPQGAPPRRWASRRELNQIEELAFAYRVQLAHASVLRILPVAVDANVLLNALARVAAGKPTDLLDAARLGLIRVYVGERVPTEVERNLEWRAQRARVPASALERIWIDEVRPLLRVVDTGELEHPNLARIVERHVNDRPTAVLSLFIGARLTWSEDPDLREEGYAERLNVEIVVAAQKVGEFDLSAHLALNISSGSLSAAGRAVMRAIERPGPERTVAILVVLLAAGALTVALIKDADRVKQTAARVAQVGVEALREASGYRDTEGGKLPAVPVPSAAEPLPVRVGHALAMAPAPLTSAEITAVLEATGSAVGKTQVETALRTYRAFVNGPDGWQLGAW